MSRAPAISPPPDKQHPAKRHRQPVPGDRILQMAVGKVDARHAAHGQTAGIGRIIGIHINGSTREASGSPAVVAIAFRSFQ